MKTSVKALLAAPLLTLSCTGAALLLTAGNAQPHSPPEGGPVMMLCGAALLGMAGMKWVARRTGAV